MFKKLLIFTLAFFVCFSVELLAQSVKIKREAMSPGMLKLSSRTAPNWPVYTGLRTVGKGSKVYLTTIDSGAVTSYTWSFVERPSGSSAVMDSVNKQRTTFTPDLVGKYVVRVTINGGASHQDTIYADTYMGNASTGLTCATCHAGFKPEVVTILNEWKVTNHAKIYREGITGQLEVVNGKGSYSSYCVNCHTIGFDKTVDNGNFGFAAKQTGWDTTWYKKWGNSKDNVSIPYGDSTQFILMNNSYPTVSKMATIGCESCHGPLNNHATGTKSFAKTYEAGVCLVCHDAPSKHMLGSLWAKSNHATLPMTAGEQNRTSCFPCHNGNSLQYFLKNPKAPNYSAVDLITESISCQACHDPHSDANPKQLRTVSYALDTLIGGYVIPANLGGKGKLCMNCHRGRYDSKDKVLRQVDRFTARFYPHYSPQTDMFWGANAYDFGLTTLNNLSSHKGVEDACVTCHMQTITMGSAIHSDHQMTMEGQDSVKVNACRSCHGSYIDSYDDIIAAADYDGNGVIESATTEIAGLLTKLKAVLPKDTLGDPVKGDNLKDSLKIPIDPATGKRSKNILGAIWNYYYVVEDMSAGIHNTKFAAALLQASLGKVTGVEPTNTEIPKTFSISQNYPNPFNPSTEIRFSVPKSASVSIQVYNSLGKLIKNLADGDLAPGNYTVSWNGDDQSGNKVASGIYIYRLTASAKDNTKFVQSKKMVLMK